MSWLRVGAGLNGEANPIAALGELLTDTRFGAGLPSSALDTGSLLEPPDLMAHTWRNPAAWGQGDRWRPGCGRGTWSP